MSLDKILVPSEGSPNAKLVLVGEAPGAIEVRQGKPFVGPAGELLNRLLSSAGVSRYSCYITNVIKEQPPSTDKKTNDVSTFLDLSRKNLAIETEAYKEYLAQLKAELECTTSNTFVAFGNVPLYALTGIFPPNITKRRGSVYPCTLVPGRKVVASIHPAACLHEGRDGGMYIWQYLIAHDIQRAIIETGYPNIRGAEYEVITEPSYYKIKENLAIMLQLTQVAFDIEVVNLEVSCISLAGLVNDRIRSISIPFLKGGKEYMTPDQEESIWRDIANILGDGTVKKIGQNLVFDTQFLFRKYGIVTRNTEDTMIAHAIAFPDFPKGLDFIASMHTTTPYYKDEGKKYLKIGGSDLSFWEYNAKDSGVCIDAFPSIMQDIERSNNQQTYDRQKKLIEVLVYMSERGVKIDREAIDAESKRIGEELEVLQEQLNESVGRVVNPDSPKQLQGLFYEELGFRPYINRKTGTPTTDEDALKRLSRKGAKPAEIILKMRSLSKMKGTYLDAKFDSDDRIRCSYNPVGTTSGRLSSSKTIWGTGINMQTDPPEFRKFLLFDDAYVGYNIDLSQAENRIVAYVAPEPAMIEAFESRVDVHRRTASFIYEKPEEEITDDERQWGKRANHGLNYGLGHKTFALYYDIPENQAQKIVLRYHQAYPGIQKYQQDIVAQLSKNRTIENLMHRHRVYRDRWGDALFKEAYSFIPQSTVADVIDERGLIYIYYNRDLFLPVELLAQRHDSIAFQIPLSVPWNKHAEILLAIKESLETPLIAGGRSFVIPADLQMGANMYKYDVENPFPGAMRKISWKNWIMEGADRLEETWALISSGVKA